MRKGRLWGKDRFGTGSFPFVGFLLLLVGSFTACQAASPPVSLSSPPSLSSQSPSSSAKPSLLPPVIADFTASRTEVTSGWAVTLYWTVMGTAGVSIDQGVGEVVSGGSVTVRPVITTTYTLTATNAAGTVTESLVITVNIPSPLPPPPLPPPPPRPSCPSCR